MTNPTVWVVGGVDKGNDYEELIPLVQEKVKAIICLGKDNSKIIEAFSGVVDTIVETQSPVEAVGFGYQLAKKDETVCYHLLVQVLTFLKIMKTVVSSLRTLFVHFNF